MSERSPAARLSLQISLFMAALFPVALGGSVDEEERRGAATAARPGMARDQITYLQIN